MSQDRDLPYNFTDKQGKEFTIWAGSEAEAWRFAKETSAARDQEFRQARSDKIDAVIDAIAHESKERTRAEVRDGAGANGLQGSLARPNNTEYLSPNISYIGASGGAATGSSSISVTTDETYSSGYGLSCIELLIVGFAAVVLIVFMAVWL